MSSTPPPKVYLDMTNAHYVYIFKNLHVTLITFLRLFPVEPYKPQDTLLVYMRLPV